MGFKKKSRRQITMNEAALRFEQVILTSANTVADLALMTGNPDSRARRTERVMNSYERASSILSHLRMPEREARILYEKLEELKQKLLLLGYETEPDVVVAASKDAKTNGNRTTANNHE